MNERIEIQLVNASGNTVPVDRTQGAGLILGRETDAFPRYVAIGLHPHGDVTKFRMKRVRQMHGWAADEFRLALGVHRGRLTLQGEHDNGLPWGSYWLYLRIADLRTKKRRGTKAKLPEGKSILIDVEVARDPRRVIIDGDFDARIDRIMRAPAPRIDGDLIADWIRSPRPRASRRACLLNILAKLRAIPSTTAPLVDQLESVIFAATDRIYAKVQPSFYGRLAALADPSTGRRAFFYEGSPTSGTHARLLTKINPPDPHGRRHTLHSFRHRQDPSLQAVVAVPNTSGRPHFADLDIDLGNPLRDLKGFITHMGELVDPGKTDHLKLWKKLRKQRAGKYLNYRVAK